MTVVSLEFFKAEKKADKRAQVDEGINSLANKLVDIVMVVNPGMSRYAAAAYLLSETMKKGQEHGRPR